MKYFLTPGILLGALLVFLSSCTTVAEIPVPTDEAKIDCNYPAQVEEGPCGLYLTLEDGTELFVRNSRGVELEAGMNLMINYWISTKNEKNTGCDYNEGPDSACGDNSTLSQGADQIGDCMSRAGISEAQLDCITVISSAGIGTTD